jgi:hypothetical protein
MKHTLSPVLISLLLFSVSSYAQFSIIDSTFNDTTQVDRQLSSSYGNDAITTNPTGTKLTLARGESENLAKGKKAYVVYTGAWPLDSSKANGSRVVDDNTSTWIIIDGRGTGRDNSGTYIMIDLQSIRLVNRIVIKQPFEQANPLLRVRAYTIEAGTDSVTMTRVLQQPNNLSTNPDTTFDVITARFVKISVDAVDPASNQTAIAEIRVFGTGYLSEGAYVTIPKPALNTANWGTVTWEAVLPDPQTSLDFQFRTGDTSTADSTWSPWSSPLTTNNSVFGVFEPRKYIQYRVNLKTTSLGTPQLNRITINYDTVMVAASVVASIDGRVEPILKSVDVVYHILMDFKNGNYGVDTIRLITPTPIIIKLILRDNVVISPRVLYGLGDVKIVFSDTISTKTEIVIEFSATLYLDEMSFPSEISSSKSSYYNPQRVERNVIGGKDSWTILTTGFADRLLVDIKIEPNPFTPNGDGKNDETAITFYVSNITTTTPRTLAVSIFDVTGRRVRDLYRNNVVAAPFVGLSAIRWDGRNNDGSIVRPGLYIIRVDLAADQGGGETVCKTVTVVY